MKKRKMNKERTKMNYSGRGVSSGKVKGKITKTLMEEGILLIDSLKPIHFLNPKKTKGVIMREGGLLSHGAIITREYKIPCIISKEFPDVKTGTVVEIDADKGQITIIE
jgi:phosphoenolpyruvate-protein kinase (PTS system EI component)